jgi:Putative transposase
VSLSTAHSPQVSAALNDAPKVGRLTFREPTTLRLHPAYEDIGLCPLASPMSSYRSSTASIRPVTISGTRHLLLVIPHTFGRHLNFNCHLHILISDGGLSVDGRRWRDRCSFDRALVMRAWRYAVISYTKAAAVAGLLRSDLARDRVLELLALQEERNWIVDIKKFQSKTHVLAYAGRYARRPPIAQHRFRSANRHFVRFATRDTLNRTGIVGGRLT